MLGVGGVGGWFGEAWGKRGTYGTCGTGGTADTGHTGGAGRTGRTRSTRGTGAALVGAEENGVHIVLVLHGLVHALVPGHEPHPAEAEELVRILILERRGRRGRRGRSIGE